MNDGSILFIPIQINGGKDRPTNLKDRELYVLDNGTLYVGRKNAQGSIDVIEVAGRVISGATIDSPTLSGNITLGNGVAPKGSEGGQLKFVDAGSFQMDGVDEDDLIQILLNIANSGGSSTTNQILHATLE